MTVLSLCFVKKGNQIALINRNKAPFKGMWNALGGHLEKNETIQECAIREIYEESGIKVDNIKVISKCSWNIDDDIFYAFVSELDDNFDTSIYPLKINEGIVDFKDIDWIIAKDNEGVVPDLKLFIADIQSGNYHDYHLTYDEEGRLLDYQIKS